MHWPLWRNWAVQRMACTDTQGSVRGGFMMGGAASGLRRHTATAGQRKIMFQGGGSADGL